MFEPLPIQQILAQQREIRMQQFLPPPKYDFKIDYAPKSSISEILKNNYFNLYVSRPAGANDNKA